MDKAKLHPNAPHKYTYTVGLKKRALELLKTGLKNAEVTEVLSEEWATEVEQKHVATWARKWRGLKDETGDPLLREQSTILADRAGHFMGVFFDFLDELPIFDEDGTMNAETFKTLQKNIGILNAVRGTSLDKNIQSKQAETGSEALKEILARIARQALEGNLPPLPQIREVNDDERTDNSVGRPDDRSLPKVDESPER